MIEAVPSIMHRFPRRMRRAVTLLTFGVFAFAGSARLSHALPHLKLVRSSPAADTVLLTSPNAIRLWLSEPTNAMVSKITLGTESGVPVPLGPLTGGTTSDAPMVATIPTPLANGGYKVTWKAMSKDGHVVNGVFAFRIRAAK